MSNIEQLKDMFPSVESRTIEALIIASQGAIEPATNALLYLSDPNSHIEVPTTLQDNVPPPPPRPSTAEMERRKQMQADEDLAKKLARSYQRKPQPRRPQNNGGDIDDDDEEDIVETLNKNLNEAKNVVGGWFDNVAKKLQGDAPQQRSSIPYNNDNIRPHYEQDDVPPPRLPARKSTGQLYSALDTGSMENTSSKVAANAAITLKDVTGDDDLDDEEAKPKDEPKEESKDVPKASPNQPKNENKWQQLAEVAPEPTVGTSKVTASATTPDDSGFVVDDSEEEEEEEVKEKPEEDSKAN